MNKSKIKAIKSVKPEKREMWIKAVVANLKNVKLHKTVEFLIDTGAGITAIPIELAKILKLKPVGKTEIILADGSVVEANLAYAYIYIPKAGGVATLISYDGCDTPLLGFDIMDTLDLQISPGHKEVLTPIRRRGTGKLTLVLNKKQSRYWKFTS